MFDKHKFKSLVHYICDIRSRIDPSSLGAVKLRKALWLSDFTAFRDLGHPITGARYVKRKYGPVPEQIDQVLQELKQEGTIGIRETFFHGFRQAQYSSYKMSSVQFLSAEERAIVDKAIAFVCDEHTASSISEFSHDVVWTAALNGEELPYHAAFVNPGQITAEDREWARMQLEAEV